MGPSVSTILAPRGSYAEAIEVLTDGLIENPKVARLHHDLAALHLARGDLEAAIKAMKTAVDLEPENSVFGERPLGEEDGSISRKGLLRTADRP